MGHFQTDTTLEFVVFQFEIYRCLFRLFSVHSVCSVDFGSGPGNTEHTECTEKTRDEKREFTGSIRKRVATETHGTKPEKTLVCFKLIRYGNPLATLAGGDIA